MKSIIVFFAQTFSYFSSIEQLIMKQFYYNYMIYEFALNLLLLKKVIKMQISQIKLIYPLVETII